MMDRKAIWKPGIAEIVKASRDFAPEPHKGGGLNAPLNPQLQGPTGWRMFGYGLRP